MDHRYEAILAELNRQTLRLGTGDYKKLLEELADEIDSRLSCLQEEGE